MTDQLKQEVISLGWHYIGKCTCSSAAHKFVKDNMRLEVGSKRSMWVITKSNVVILKGGWDSLIEHLRRLANKAVQTPEQQIMQQVNECLNCEKV